jgi:hypothetical protein
MGQTSLCQSFWQRYPLQTVPIVYQMIPIHLGFREMPPPLRDQDDVAANGSAGQHLVCAAGDLAEHIHLAISTTEIFGIRQGGGMPRMRSQAGEMFAFQ